MPVCHWTKARQAFGRGSSPRASSAGFCAGAGQADQRVRSGDHFLCDTDMRTRAQSLGQELPCGSGPGRFQVSTVTQSSLIVGNLTASKGSGTFYE